MSNGLKSLDDIFGGINNEGKKEERNAADEKSIVDIEIDKLIDYRKGNIGEKRYSDEDMDDLVQSVKEHGVIQPATVRPIEDGMYEIILGHHRRDASLLAGIETLPCIIQKMDDTQAEALFIDSNIQKGYDKLSYSEKAELIYRRNEVLKAQGKRTDLMDEDEKEGIKTTKDEFHISGTTVKRYLRIYQLVDEIKELLDQGQIGLRAAVNISYLTEDLQKHLSWLLTDKCMKINEKASAELKECFDTGNLNQSSMEDILKENKKPEKKKRCKVKSEVLERYFQPEQPQKEIDEIVEKALKMYFKKND